MWSHKSFVYSFCKVFFNFHNSPIVLFSLVVVTFKCFSKVNRASRNIPRCFWYGDCETILLLKLNEGWQIFLVFLLKIIFFACLIANFALKFYIYWFDTNYYFIHLQKCQHRRTEIEDVSSASNFAFNDEPSARLLI